MADDNTTGRGTGIDRRSRRARVRYWIDGQFDRGTAALIRLLALTTVGFVAVGAIVMLIARIGTNTDGHPGFVEAYWQGLIRTLDPGTMGSDAGWGFRLVSLGVTIGGIFIVSTLIGLLATGMERRLTELRRGKSPVIESGHTVILGWSERVEEMARELAVAAENQSRACLVVLADRDKAEMEEALRGLGNKRSKLKIVCRTGDPGSTEMLQRISVGTCKSVMIPRQRDACDADAVRRALAALAVGAPSDAPIVVELEDSGTAIALTEASGGRVITLVTDDVVARITSEICCAGGLSDIVLDLLDFDGDEIYLQVEPRLVGASFHQAMLAYPTCAPIGIRRRDGSIHLAPPMSAVFEEGDAVIAIAEDDDRIVLPDSDLLAPPTVAEFIPAEAEPPRQLLIVGWSGVGAALLKELDHRLPHGSQVEVVFDRSLVAPGSEPDGIFQRFELRVREGDTTRLDTLKPLVEPVSGRPPDRVLLMAYRSRLDRTEADARTVLAFLTMRRLPSIAHIGIAAELRIQQNEALLSRNVSDDLIIGERLAALMLTQISESRDLDAIFEQLFGPDGADFRVLSPAQLSLETGATTFGRIAELGAERGFVPIGVRVAGRAITNPDKRDVFMMGSRPDDVVFGVSTHHAGTALDEKSRAGATCAPGGTVTVDLRTATTRSS